MHFQFMVEVGGSSGIELRVATTASNPELKQRKKLEDVNLDVLYHVTVVSGGDTDVRGVDGADG